MVQNCLFARISEFQFGVRSKKRVQPSSAGSEFGESTGPNLGSAGSEFGLRPIPFSKLRTLAVSEFGERTGPNLGLAGSEFGERPIPFSKLRTLAGLEKGPGRTLVRQVRSSEKGPFLSPNSEPWQVWRKDRAKPWFGRFGVRRKEQVQQVLAFLKKATASLFRNARQGK